jgi:nicotinamide-nucleotide amidase
MLHLCALKKQMKAEIITIGDELLIGQTIDTNSAWIGEQLNLSGVQIYQITSISDDKQHIKQAIKNAESRVDLILITGGLGPTRDDITKNTLCEYFDTHLEMNREILERIEGYFTARGIEVLEVNRQQAALPAAAKIVPNYLGTASGMWFEKDGKVIISMPGVPYEMKAMMETTIIPMVGNYFQTSTILKKTVLTQGMGESSLALRIQDWESSLRGDGLELAYLPSPGLVKLRVTAREHVVEDAALKLDGYLLELHQLIPDLIFGYSGDTLESVVGQLLLKKNAKLATAESCTGGYIAHLITSIPGSSAYFEGTVVSYSNEIKSNVLGVNMADIEANGAVSEPVVRQMAEGVRAKLKADYSIATSGIAGPDGGTEEKPVGTVWIAVSTPEKTIAKKFLIGKDRERNVRISAIKGLDMLRRQLM